MAKTNRRRFIQLAAAFGTASTLPLSALARPVPMARWEGIALGADAQIVLAHVDQKRANATLQQCVSEINRLENIFSLYRADSAICRLNREKICHRPPEELVKVIKAALQFGKNSKGLFDISIQPLWKLYHDHFQTEGADPNGPSLAAVAEALKYVDYRRINCSPDAISLKPGMEITLNGIAQGYVTDRIAALLEGEGYQNALVNLGEYQAKGEHPEGRNWQVGIPSPQQPWRLAREIAIPPGKALATSGGYGTRWSQMAHHLLSPQTGRSISAGESSVTVIANSAMEADALSTLFALKPGKSLAEKLTKHYITAKIIAEPAE